MFALNGSGTNLSVRIRNSTGADRLEHGWGSDGPTTPRYEAESAPAVCTGSIDSNWSGYSGTGFCNGDNTTGAYAQFTIDASSAGTATLGIRFANGTTGARPADLVVNGSVAQGVSFEGTGSGPAGPRRRWRCRCRRGATRSG